MIIDDYREDFSHTPRKLIDAYQQIVDYLTEADSLTTQEIVNFEGTAERCAKSLLSMCYSKRRISLELDEILSKGFPTNKSVNSVSNGMVVQSPIKAYSVCPHHMLPVFMEVSVAYMPSPEGHVLGLSKLARLVKLLAKRPILQEQLCKDIADVLCKGSEGSYPSVTTLGSAVSITAKHSCMECRGVHSSAYTVTTELRGNFIDYPECKSEFYDMLNRIPKN